MDPIAKSWSVSGLFSRKISGGKSDRMEPTDPQDARRRKVLPLIEGYIMGELSPTLAFQFDVHRNRCSTCGRFLRALCASAPIPSLSADLLEHIGRFSNLPR